MNRFAIQLLAPSAILSKLSGRTEITVEDIAENGSLFLDARSSASVLQAQAKNDVAGNGRSEYLR